jgi:hypothetical protein
MRSVPCSGWVLAAPLLKARVVVGGNEVIEMVESYLEYRVRPTEGISL